MTARGVRPDSYLSRFFPSDANVAVEKPDLVVVAVDDHRTAVVPGATRARQPLSGQDVFGELIDDSHAKRTLAHSTQDAAPRKRGESFCG